MMQILINISVLLFQWEHRCITSLELCPVLSLNALKIERTNSLVSSVLFSFFVSFLFARF